MSRRRTPNARAFSTDLMRGEWCSAAGPLTPAEHVHRARLEAVIERGLRTFFEVGTALHLIRAEKLYRDRYRTFTDYCRERWGFSASRTRQLIAAGRSVTVVMEADLLAPPTERVARKLNRLRSHPERQRAA